MKMLDLFSGIGGFSLAARWMGWETVQFVEWDSFCQKVLSKHWPNVPIHSDIKDFDGTKYRNTVDIISGGFPCQPFSVAGKQQGADDNRFLWPEMLRVIREVQPTWIVGENVPGIIRMELDNICASLENEGYEVQPFIIPSASIGAWDKRDRVWIIANRNIGSNTEYQLQARREMHQSQIKFAAYNNNSGLPQSRHESGKQKIYEGIGTEYCNSIPYYPISSRRENGLHGRKQEREAGKCGHSFKESDWWKRNWIEVASELCRSNARVPNRMDRIKGLGNSINPYVAYQIFKAIEQYNQSIAKNK